MAKKKQKSEQSGMGTATQNLGFLLEADQWQSPLQEVTARYNREYRQAAVELPPEVEAMPIFQAWNKGQLQMRIASPFWEVTKPRKNEHWLDIGCGLSFLVYPWRDWNAFFYGQDLSPVAQEVINQRGPQLNSKLFRGVERGAAHRLKHPEAHFDGVVATGFSCYYPVDYWREVVSAVKRVLKPQGTFLMDVITPESELAENWAILETYLGAEVILEPLETWQQMLRDAGGKIMKTHTGELFTMYKVRF